MGNDKQKIVQTPAYATFVPVEKKIQAEQILVGALLREPFNIYQHLGQLNRTALSFASNDLAQAFIEILDQFAQHGKYSAMSVYQKTGINIAQYASSFTDIDLGWAVSEWWIEYERWGEMCAMAAAMSENVASEGALSMRGAAETERERLGLNGGISTVSSADKFLEWGMSKIDGNEVIYKTTPPMDCLKEYIKSFEPGDVVIIAARPSMGKTQAGLNLHSHFHDQGAKGAFISLEMMGDRLFRRMLGVRHGINPIADWSILDKGVIGRGLTETASIDKTNPIVNDVFNMSEIESWAISAHYRGELEYLIVDYLGLITPTAKKQNREQEVASISGALARLAKRLKIPVFPLSQLSRAVETRGGTKRPQLSDLRDSGSVEQDADIVIFLHRPEYYGILEDESGNSLKGAAEWIIAKNRNGGVGTAVCSFNPIRGFKDLPTETKNFPPATVDYTEPVRDLAQHRPKSDEDIPF